MNNEPSAGVRESEREAFVKCMEEAKRQLRRKWTPWLFGKKCYCIGCTLSRCGLRKKIEYSANGTPYKHLRDFNNDPNTTRAMMLALMDNGIAAAKESS